MTEINQTVNLDFETIRSQIIGFFKEMSKEQLTRISMDIDEIKIKRDGFYPHSLLGNQIITSLEPCKPSRSDIVQLSKEFTSRQMKSEGIELNIVHKRGNRTIVALKKDQNGKVTKRGVARCHHSDCYNRDIGSAIAIFKCLGRMVPKLLMRVPQPKDILVGDIVVFWSNVKQKPISRIVVEDSALNDASREVGISYVPMKSNCKVIDDSKRKHKNHFTRII